MTSSLDTGAMNEENATAVESVQDFAEAGHDTLNDLKQGARVGFDGATEFVRANPWVAVGIAVVAGGLLAVLSRPSKPKPKNMDLIREWLEEARTKLPSQKQLQSAADNTCAPSFLKALGKKLHLI